ncbi:MAG: hypothetical protein V9G12_16220 [Microthrixaceae bacterium]
MNSSRCTAVVSGVRFHRSSSWPIGPLLRGGVPPPIETRSFMRVVIATAQPRPTSSTRIESGTRTSVKYTSLNSASPVI